MTHYLKNHLNSVTVFRGTSAVMQNGPIKALSAVIKEGTKIKIKLINLF
jgi:uncharacterized Zn ribbon protein